MMLSAKYRPTVTENRYSSNKFNDMGPGKNPNEEYRKRAEQRDEG
jgi:hypothetical protein